MPRFNVKFMGRTKTRDSWFSIQNCEIEAADSEQVITELRKTYTGIVGLKIIEIARSTDQ